MSRKSYSLDFKLKDEILIQKPTAAEVRKALTCLQDFCLCSQVEPSVLDSIASIQTQLNNVISSQAKQMKLTDFLILSDI